MVMIAVETLQTANSTGRQSLAFSGLLTVEIRKLFQHPVIRQLVKKKVDKIWPFLVQCFDRLVFDVSLVVVLRLAVWLN
ncbi:hypothetical protein OS493_035000 [Desmophyllum pertusum]|uniref:Uncharacterized protein n=1 Tax=Desmophyllum pertusum TaxID=174260 RepID=A0A9X0CDX4_9CNID|nr:hypothetical protein OS493_035000 [Desmophyllum pertusum]